MPRFLAVTVLLTVLAGCCTRHACEPDPGWSGEPLACYRLEEKDWNDFPHYGDSHTVVQLRNGRYWAIAYRARGGLHQYELGRWRRTDYGFSFVPDRRGPDWRMEFTSRVQDGRLAWAASPPSRTDPYVGEPVAHGPRVVWLPTTPCGDVRDGIQGILPWRREQQELYRLHRESEGKR